MTEKQLTACWPQIRMVAGGCWLWTGRLAKGGYAKTGGRLVHRLVYEYLVGLIPQGLELDHLCRRRACVNPTHVEPVTHAENVRRGAGCKASPFFDPALVARRGASPLKGRQLSTAHRAKLSALRKGRPHSAAHVARVAAAQRGQKRPQTSQRLMGNTNFAGHAHTTETKAKMAAARRAYWARKKGAAA